MIGTDFLIITIFLILNLVLLMIKDQKLVYPTILLSIFTIFISIYYIIDLGFEISIHSLYITFIALIAVITLWIKGNEQY